MSGYALEFIEIDIKYCSLRYGEGACAASGSVKCFNTKATCQARPSYTEQIVTLRFGRNTSEYERSGIDHIPCLDNVNLMPARISLGEDLGTRASLDVSFTNIPWPDTGLGFDKYADERDYDPYKTGTFWGKFFARQPFLQGQPIRHIQGMLGQTLEEMTTRHFEIETFSKTNKRGASISARDILKRADGDRSQCPVASSGYVRSDITETDTAFLLSPIGIGDIEYPASGLAAIGGKEVVRFTRSGDTMTITRGQENTAAVAHKAQDKVQVCKEWFGIDPADIAYDLLVNYAGVPASYIDLQSWKDETSAYVRQLQRKTHIHQHQLKTGLFLELCHLGLNTMSREHWYSHHEPQSTRHLARFLAHLVSCGSKLRIPSISPESLCNNVSLKAVKS